MKTAPLSALLLALAPAGAAIPLDGLADYTQNFDVLAITTNNSTSTTAWADDATIPGWYIYRAGNGTPPGFAGAAYSYRVSDGGLTAPNTLINTGWMFSLGNAGDAERAMGCVPITAQGEFSFIAVFQNNSALPVRLSNIAYTVEVRRSSQNPNNVETYAVSWKTAATEAELLTMTTAPATVVEFPAAVSTSPSAHYVTGWNALPAAGFTFTNNGVAANQLVDLSYPVSAVPETPVDIPPGQFFAIRWGNINDGGADALMGIDDIVLTFRAADQPTLFASPAGPVTIDNQGTETPADDTFSGPFTIINTLTDPSTGWSSNETPPRTGLYATAGPVTFGPYPVAGGARSVTITDDLAAAASATFTLTPPGRSLTLSPAGNIVRNANDPGGADDTVSFDVTITGQNGGPGWIAAGTSPLTGAFGPNTLTVPAGLASFTLTVSDISYPSLSRSITVALPGPYIIGYYDTGAGSMRLFTDEAAPPAAAWVINADAGTLTMTDGDAAGAGVKTVTSELISNPGGPSLEFSANLHVRDLTSGFEDPDTFSAVLIVNGDTANPIPTFLAHDTSADGLLSGAELCPRPAVNGLQEFDYPLTATVPAGAASVQLIITGINDSPNETMIVSDIRFLPAAADTDGDGMSDVYETTNGLDLNSPADRDVDSDGDGQSNYQEFLAGTVASAPESVLKITANTLNPATGEGSVTFTSTAGRRYRLQVSPLLDMSWTDFGTAVIATSASTTITATIPGAPLTGFGFLRVRVVP